MNAFQNKVEKLLALGEITKDHYESVKEFFDIHDDETRKVELTPLAQELLLATSPKNRKQPPNNLAQLMAQINRAEFHDYNMIGINDKGELRDGHGRLTAGINAGKNLPTRITFNVPDEKFTAIDTGAKRKPYEEMIFSDKFESQFGKKATHQEFSILRIYFTYGANKISWRYFDPRAQRHLIFDMADEFAFIAPFLNKKSLAVTIPVLGAFMRVYSVTKEKEKLTTALNLLYDEDSLMSDDRVTDDSREQIRKLYTANIKQQKRAGWIAENKMFKRTLDNLALYLNMKKALFPIPEKLLAKAEKLNTNHRHDFDLLAPLCRWLRTQNYGVIKTYQVVDGVMKMGYNKYPAKTVAKKLLNLVKAFNYDIEILGFGSMKGKVNMEKINAGKRTRCDEFEIVK